MANLVQFKQPISTLITQNGTKVEKAIANMCMKPGNPRTYIPANVTLQAKTGTIGKLITFGPNSKSKFAQAGYDQVMLSKQLDDLDAERKKIDNKRRRAKTDEETKEYYAQAKDLFDKIDELGYTPRFTDELHGKDYPSDVLFNALLLKNRIYGLTSALSKELINLANKYKIEIVNVRQGYTKCSVCKVSENAIITADEGIAKAAQARGVDVLQIRAGHVRLDGYDCGFIGGSSGASDGAVYFCGDVLSHPDGKMISEFCEKHKKSCISLSNDTLFDVGTLFFLSKV